jgi:hypothetical protein
LVVVDARSRPDAAAAGLALGDGVDRLGAGLRRVGSVVSTAWPLRICASM